MIHITFKLFLTLTACASVLALQNGEALVPPMGYNSWNAVHCRVSSTFLKAQADNMVKLGLRDAGYRSVNTDDCWLSRERDAEGRQQGASSFGDPRDVVTYVNKLNMTFGLYSAAAYTTCQSRAGSLLNEIIDAATYKSWGVSQLKYDACGEKNLNSFAKYGVMRDALIAVGASNITYYTEPHVYTPYAWTQYVANAWRTGGDITGSFSRMLYEAMAAGAWVNAGVGPGAWADADMLEVGNKGLSVSEATVHMTLWCFLKSPLLIGTDLDKISSEYLNILLNADLIAVNQDPLGAPGSLRATYASGSETLEAPDFHARALRQAEAMENIFPVWEANFDSLTACTSNPAMVTPTEQWTVSNNKIKQGEVCLTQASNGRFSTEQCVDNLPSQNFESGNVSTTLSSIVAPDGHCMSVNMTNNVPVLSTAVCAVDPPSCWHKKCDSSMRMHQLFYRSNTTGQLSSSFTTLTNMDVDAGVEDSTLPNIPLCLATSPNPPPTPPAPAPAVNGSLPLQVWAAPLKNGDVAVALVNGGSTSALITAQFTDIDLPSGSSATVYNLLTHSSEPTAMGSVSATVAPHDVAAFRLTPKSTSMISS